MYTKKGLPERGEFVLGTVIKSEGYSVFFQLDEYNKLEGMLHSNEIDRKYKRKWKSKFKPGTKFVLKVTYIDRQGHISLSHRRVGKAQNTRKLAELKNEKTADGIVMFFAKENKLSKDKVYEVIGDKILNEYSLLYPALLDIAKGEKDILEGLNIEKKLADKFEKFVTERMNIPLKIISAKLVIKSLASDGVEVIKRAIAGASKIARKHKVKFDMQYLGAPKYQMKLVMDDYKIGEKAYAEIVDFMEKTLGKDGEVEFKR